MIIEKIKIAIYDFKKKRAGNPSVICISEELLGEFTEAVKSTLPYAKDIPDCEVSTPVYAFGVRLIFIPLPKNKLIISNPCAMDLIQI